MAPIHMIRILDEEARQRAIGELIETRDTWVSLPGHIFGITNDHLQALLKATPPIAIEFLSKTQPNGQPTRQP